MVGWIKMPLGKEIGLGPGNIVLDGDPAPTAAPPHFQPMPIVTKWSPIAATAELLLLFLSCSLYTYEITRRANTLLRTRIQQKGI